MLKPKVKVLFLISSFPRQGPVQVLLDIVKNIDYNIFEVAIITFKKSELNSIKTEFEILPVKIICFNSKCIFSLPLLLYKVSNFVKLNNIDIVHSHCFISLIINSLITYKTNKVHTIHIYPGIQSVSIHGRFYGFFINLISKYIFKKFPNPVACSQSVADDLWRNDKIIVSSIINGISKSKISNLNKLTLRDKLNLDKDCRYFISVGRFSPEKNFKIIVESFVEANYENTKLIILGDGGLYNEVKKKSNKNVILPGFKSNVVEYLYASDYYVSASLTEGMPLSVLEAMSSGIPLMLSEIPSHIEIFKSCLDLEIGILFSSDNKQSFKDSFSYLLNYPNYSTLSNNAKYIFDRYYTSDRMSIEYQNFYKKIINYVQK